MAVVRATRAPATRAVSSGRLASGLALVAVAAASVVAVAQESSRDLVDDRAGLVQPVQQQAGVAPGALDPNSFYGKESTEGVYVRDSALALEKFALAQRMERLKEWAKSADLYQEILEKYADRVVPSQVDKDNKIYQYTSVTLGVQDQLARWPQEGRDVYRARYEAAATQMVESAGKADLFALNQVFSKYFITDAGKQAGLRLIELNTERGEFLAAAEKGDRLADRHPSIAAERPAVLFRTAMAYYLAGDAQRAYERLDRLKRDHGQDVGVVRGKEVVLAAALEQELKAPLAAGGPGAGGDSYPMFGGDPSRGRISAAKVSPGAPLFDVPLARPQWEGVQGQHRQAMEHALAIAEREGLTLGVMPAVDRGELYFQDGRRVYAVSLASGGLPLSGWRQTYAGERDGQFVLPGTWGSARSYQHTVTLTDTAVLAVMGQGDRRATEIGVARQSETRLVCLDRATGAPNWVIAPSGIVVPKEAEGVRQLQFMGSPLVLGDSVLVAGRSGKGQQFEDCWVVCFDLASGKYRWSSYVASSTTPSAMLGMQGGAAQQMSDNATHLAYGDGRVYVMTNLGALAALDAYSGTILWLNIYPRNTPQGMDPNVGFNAWGMQQVQAAQHKPWTFNPVIVQQGKLFALPSDGRFLMVYDSSSGVEVKRIRLSHLAEADTVLGVHGDRLIVTGNDRIVCLNWPKYDPEKFNDDMLFWRAGPLRFPIRGRGLVTQDSVYIPAGDRLFRYDLKLGKAVETYPPYDTGRTWEKGSEGPGNVVATSDYVVIAGDQRVNVYTDLAAAKKRLDAEVAAAPADAQPRLRYAGLLFAAGDSAAALGKLDEAIALLGGLNTMTPGTGRDQVFNDALTFAEKLSAANNAEQRPRVMELYARAAAAADSPGQHVRFRFSRAKLAETERDAATSVDLYQQVLADAKFRGEQVNDETTGAPAPAGTIAERSIRNLIRLAGAGVYSKYQQAAAAALAEAQQAGEPAKLLAVAQVYPNASVAPQAMLAAADAFEAAGDPKAAVNILRPMYFKFPDSRERPRIIEAMARNYLQLEGRRGSVDSAAARLAQGASLPGGLKLARGLKLPDGKELPAGLTFEAALDEVRKYTGKEAVKNLPDFRLPTPRRRTKEEKLAAPSWPFRAAAAEHVINDVTSLVLPLRDFSRPDRLVTWTAGRGLSVFPSASNQPLGSSDSVSQPPQKLAWIDDDLLVWGATHVALVPGAGGPAKWKLDVAALPPLEVTRLADAAGAGNANLAGGFGNQPFGGAQVMIQGNRQFMLRNGMMQPMQAPPVAPRPAAGAGEQIAEVRPVGDRVLVSTTTGRLLSAELPTGRVAWQNRLSDRPLDRVVATEDFAVARTSDETHVRLVALDTFTGQHLGTKPFPTQSGLVPMNMALSPDGTLVYTLPNALVLKDLYKPFGDPASEKPIPGPVQQPPYTGATRPDQLVIAEGRILALADGGPQIGVTPDKYVRLHSLETGLALPLRYRTGKGDEEVDRVLTTANKSWDIGLRVVGSHLYVVGSRAVVSYNLDRPAESWSTASTLPNATIRDSFIGREFLAILEQPDALANAALRAAAEAAGPAGVPGGVPVPGQPVPLPGAAQPALPEPGQQPANVNNPVAEKPSTTYRLHVYGLYAVSEKNPAQSGRLDYVKEITDPAGITANWQPIDGGFAYQTADGKVKMLLGAEPAK